MNLFLEKSIAKYLALGLFVTTIIVIVGPVSDPVNISKLFVLGATGFSALIIFFDAKLRANLMKFKLEFFVSVSMVLAGLIVTFLSAQPFERSLYGISGRNFGLLTLISYLLIYVALSQLQNKSSIELILYSFGASGLINVLYGILATYINDPIQWNNVYGALLGTFGNPNFAGSFYGIFSAYLLAMVLDSKRNRNFRFLALALIPLNVLCILATKTTQGILVFGISNSIVIFYYLKLVIKKPILNRAFVLSFLFASVFVILGILQKGPLTDLLYKRSVSLRGVYWDAAYNTGLNHILTGVGFDGLGDWYRRYRSLKAATWLPGPEVVTNSAHNQFLDYFAFGGLALLIPYLLLIGIGFWSVYRINRNQKDFDFIPVTLVAMFIGHVAQSIISLHQIGITVWGWVLMALLSSYAKSFQIEKVTETSTTRKQKNNQDSPWSIGIFLGACIGVILCLPPFTAEAKLTSAVGSKDYYKIETALKNSYFTPLNSESLNRTIILLETNNLSEQALQLARRAVVFNPDSFDSWKLLYYLSLSSTNDKNQAKSNMQRLDPLNKKLATLK